MAAGRDLRRNGERIEHLLDSLQGADPRSCAKAEEALRLASELYGAGLARVMELADERLKADLGADPLVKSLLVVHGLHPDSLESRLSCAIAALRPLLAGHGGDVELLEVDEAAGAVRLRLLGSCDGCPSSALTLKGAVERAIAEHAPEISVIDVDDPATAPPASALPAPGGRIRVELSTKPDFTECPAQMVDV